VQQIREQRHGSPPPSLEEAKLRFLLVGRDISWTDLIRKRPFMATGAAISIGALLGWSRKLRGACGGVLKKGVGRLARKRHCD